MSDATHQHDEDGPHEGPIKTPKQLVLAVFFAFVIPIIGIILLANFVSEGKRPAAGSDALSPQATAERIRPVGVVEVKDASVAGALKTGEQVYGAVCSACHGAGTLGAPKFGDAAAWAPRIPQGFETLLSHALKGYKAMPPQGGGDSSDVEIGRAVVYMANKGGAKFEEPKVATQAASAPAAGAEPQAASPATTTAPVASAPVNASASAAAAEPALYKQACSTCHGAGLLNAPKLGDKAAWAPRITQGIDALVANAIKGKNAMPPRGGSGASDADIRGVVTYMVSKAK